MSEDARDDTFTVDGREIVIGPRVGPRELGLMPTTPEYVDRVAELDSVWDHRSRPEWTITAGKAGHDR